MTQSDLIQNLHTLVSHNVIGDKQLFSRYKGFRAELELEQKFADDYPKATLRKGGIIISKSSKKSSLNDSVYFTLLPSDEDLKPYQRIYHYLSRLGFKGMYLTHYDSTEWEEHPVMCFPKNSISLPVPKLVIYSYDITKDIFIETGKNPSIITDFFDTVSERHSNRYPIKESTFEWLEKNLSKFDEKWVLDLYMNRLFFDGFIGFGKKKGKSSDIDLIVERTDSLKLIEIKEKDLPKKATKGFGLDVPRIRDFQRIMTATGLSFHLIVKHINDQKERKLVGWKFISVEDFIEATDLEKTVMGGTGMRSVHSENPTVICPLEKFGTF